MSSLVSAGAAKKERVERIALAALLVGSFVLVFQLAAPLWIGLVFGTMGALTLEPFYLRLLAGTGHRAPLSAMITTVLAGVGCSVPCVAVFYVLTGELASLIALLQTQLNSEGVLRFVGDSHGQLAERFGFKREAILAQLDRVLDNAMSYASTIAAFALQTVTSTLLAIVIGLMTLYAVLLRWPDISARLERLLPLDRRHTRAVLTEFARVGRVTLTGTFVTGLIQGVLGIIGYAMTGTPHALAWGMLTAASSLVPLIGTALVWIPVSLYLLLAGHQAMAIVNLTWGLLVVSFFGDYVVRPRLVGQRRGGSSLLIIVSILGGVEMFGVPGLVMGPVVMSLFFAILNIYERQHLGEPNGVTPAGQKCGSRLFAPRARDRALPPVRSIRQWRRT